MAINVCTDFEINRYKLDEVQVYKFTSLFTSGPKTQKCLNGYMSLKQSKFKNNNNNLSS